jgi:DNA-binding FadR family transcriptional regulator
MLSGVRAAPYAEHKRIYDAIVRKQPDKAAREATKLVREASQLISTASVDNFRKQ